MTQNNKNPKKEAGSDESIIELAKERYKLASDAVQDERRLGDSDIDFLTGDQWPAAERKTREENSRPVITINKLPQFVNQITNDQRQNRPQIKISPVDDKADIHTAKMLQGLCRHVWTNSNADTAVDNAFDNAVSRSYGYWRILTDYANDFSFDQEILIEPILNPNTVFLDPFCKKPDGSDAEFGFIEDEISKDEFERKYPDAKLSGDWSQAVQNSGDWVKEKACRILEYFYKDYKDQTIHLMSDGTVKTKEELEEKVEIEVPNEDIVPSLDETLGIQATKTVKTTLQKQLEEQGITIDKTRVSRIATVKWCKLVDNEILEKKEFPSKYIPLVPVYGKQINKDGKKILESLIRHSKDSQRIYNYLKSMEVETISLAPKTPWIATPEQIKGYEAMYQSSSRVNYGVMFYNPVSTNTGQPLPPPTRQTSEPPIQAVTQASMLASEDMKATNGMYDVTLGNRGEQKSGIAIQRANAQSQTSNFHFMDNLSRAIRLTGKILLDMFPRIYDYPTVKRIIGEDGTETMVKLNEEFTDEKTQEARYYDLSVGTYDAIVETGPSYATKRQEAAASMLELNASAPQIAQVAGDLMIKAMDWEGASEIAERLKRTIDPKILGENQDKEVPPEIQMQIQQGAETIQMLAQALKEAEAKIENKTLELASKERIESNKLEVQLVIEQAKLMANKDMALMQSQLDQLQQWQNNVQAAQVAYVEQTAQAGQGQEQIQDQNLENESLAQSGFEGETVMPNNPNGVM